MKRSETVTQNGGAAKEKGPSVTKENISPVRKLIEQFENRMS